MATRRVTATGRVYNNGNVSSEYHVHLMVEVRDEADRVVKSEGPVRVTPNFTVAPCGWSLTQTLPTYETVELYGNYAVTAWCRLDRVSPSPKDDISRSAARYYVEPVPAPTVEYSVLPAAQSVKVWSQRGGWAAPGNKLPIWDMETFNGRVTFEHRGLADRVRAVLRVDLGGSHYCWAIGSWQDIPKEANWTTHTITCGPGATFVFGGDCLGAGYTVHGYISLQSEASGLVLGGTVSNIFYTTKEAAPPPPPAHTVNLVAGNNQVIYEGTEQAASVALFQPLGGAVIIAYYFDPLKNAWVQVLANTTLKPGMILNIKVSYNITWTYY